MPPPARRRGRPPAASTSASAWPQQQPWYRLQFGAGSREAAQPVSASARPMKHQSKRHPWNRQTLYSSGFFIWGRTAFRVGSLCSTSLPHCGYVGGSPSPACSVSGGLASTPQTGLLAHENYQTRLCDSVRPASSQLQGHSVHYCAEPGYSRLASGDHGPTGEGCNRAGPSSQGFAALTSLYPIKAVGYDQSWTCTSWIRPLSSSLSSSRSRC